MPPQRLKQGPGALGDCSGREPGFMTGQKRLAYFMAIWKPTGVQRIDPQNWKVRDRTHPALHLEELGLPSTHPLKSLPQNPKLSLENRTWQ